MRRGVWLMLAAVGLAGCGRGDSAGGGKAAAGEGAAPATAAVEPGTLPSGVTREVAMQGREVYGRSCIVCHGANGGGTQMGPSLVDAQWVNVPSGGLEEVVGVVRQGVAEPKEHPVPMPGYTGWLSEEEIRAVSAYTYSLTRR